jgi:putative transposase
MRRHYSAKFKAQVALSAIREDKTLSELSSEFGTHANQIVRWKKELLARAEEVFGHALDKRSQDAEAREAELYRQIGQLKVELDWLKKKSAPHIKR